MHLSLKELHRVVEKTRAFESAVDVLREEITRVLGPSVDTKVKLAQLAEHANYRLDVLQHTGKRAPDAWHPSILLKFADDSSEEVRRFVSRALPERFMGRFIDDKSPLVRHAVAGRIPLTEARMMLRRYSYDDQLQCIVESRLDEAGMADPEPVKPRDSTHRMSKSPTEELELSDQWYETLAHQFIADYGGNLEGQWEHAVVHRYCASVKATSGVEVDEKKLYDAIIDQLKEKDDRTIERYSLKEVACGLRRFADNSIAEVEDAERVDPAEELLESHVSSMAFIARVVEMYAVKHAPVSGAVGRYMLNEGAHESADVPNSARAPMGALRNIDECVLDEFIRRWNETQARNGEPICIRWSTSPSDTGAIAFKASLR